MTAKNIQTLQDIQQLVLAEREQKNIWSQLATEPLSGLQCDLLALVCCNEIDPLVQQACAKLSPQAGGVTIGLVQELFALDLDQANELFKLLTPEATLPSKRLLRIQGAGLKGNILPGIQVVHRLTGRPAEQISLPGAIQIKRHVAWNELVLPTDRIQLLHEFLLWIRHRQQITDEWGAGPFGGPIALFTGPSGTGKTFAASVLATELGWPLYRVDLGKIVSKYIGETEKNLNDLFDAAHDAPMVLQFDEADSLFSKRGEVKDARDRYANMEVSHLLSRLESHQGPCVLTTNLRQNLDAAFARRFQTVVDFPRPDALQRATLWQKLLPPKAPRDEELDYSFMGNSVSLNGGAIRNASLHGAMLAAEEESAIGFRHLAVGVWREMGKEGREVLPSHLGSLARYLPTEIGVPYDH